MNQHQRRAGPCAQVSHAVTCNLGPALFPKNETSVYERNGLRFLFGYQFLILGFLCKRHLGSGLSTCRYGTLVHEVWQLTDNRSLATRIYLGISPLSLLCGELFEAPLFFCLRDSF